MQGWSKIKLDFTKIVFLLYLQISQTCLLKNSSLYSWYTTPNIFQVFRMRPGTQLLEQNAYLTANFLCDLLFGLKSVNFTGEFQLWQQTHKKSLQGPNLESRVAVGQESSYALPKKIMNKQLCVCRCTVVM